MSTIRVFCYVLGLLVTLSFGIILGLRQADVDAPRLRQRVRHAKEEVKIFRYAFEKLVAEHAKCGKRKDEQTDAEKDESDVPAGSAGKSAGNDGGS